MSTPPSGTARRLAVTTFKFAGVASLGLLTGSTLSLTHLAAPSLLSLSEHTGASACLTTLRGRAARLHRRLHRTALGALALAYLASPRGWRHPYLLWTALVAGVTAQYALPASLVAASADSSSPWYMPRSWRWANGGGSGGGSYVSTTESRSSSGRDTYTYTTTTIKASSGRTSPGTASQSQEWELEMGMSEAERAELGLAGGELLDDDNDTNGEAVRVRIELWSRTMARMAGGYAVAAGMALVGLWGDGFAG